MKKIVSLLPEWSKEPFRLARDFVYSILYRGTRRWCPVCGKSSRKFGEFGSVPREDARCMRCGALERHRFVWLYFTKMTNLFDGSPKKVLHVAPERCFESRLRKHLGDGYITADLSNPRAMVKMDITDIQYPEGSFDAIYCSHVLEHVQDDKKAMKEFYRILKKDGWAILLVPITADRTFEDPMIVNSSERLRIFEQEDHVRQYGHDYIDKLREAGFKVRVSHVSDLHENEDIVRMGLTHASGEIYYCTRV
jgi:predicted SAM-dependent methyltransferase